MATTTASAKRITANIGIGIRRYEATSGLNEKQYLWMLEVREHCGAGKLYAENLVTVENLRDLKNFCDDAIRTITADPAPTNKPGATS